MKPSVWIKFGVEENEIQYGRRINLQVSPNSHPFRRSEVVFVPCFYCVWSDVSGLCACDVSFFASWRNFQLSSTGSFRFIRLPSNLQVYSQKELEMILCSGICAFDTDWSSKVIRNCFLSAGRTRTKSLFPWFKLELLSNPISSSSSVNLNPTEIVIVRDRNLAVISSWSRSFWSSTGFIYIF